MTLTFSASTWYRKLLGGDKQRKPKLIYIPIAHDPWSESPEYALKATFGSTPDKKLVDEYRTGLIACWDYIDLKLSELKIDKIYQDSCYDLWGIRHYIERYREDAHKSRNFKAICSLLDRGAKLMITESDKAKNDGILRYEGDSQLIPRDEYMASNINETLHDGELGVLFIGFRHNVDKILEQRYPTITVESLNCSNLSHLMTIFEELQIDDEDTVYCPWFL